MISDIQTASNLNELWTNPWPADGLESITQCPVCGHTGREVLHADLVDNAFRAAPGKWLLWDCKNCRSAYLDPRPTADTIHLAYANYYTHQEAVGKDDYASLTPARRLRRRLVNGYTNWRYSTHAQPSSALGIVAAYTLPNLRKIIDRPYRHLPRLPKAGGKLLDLGCGDGTFLRLARACGWQAFGLDPDPKAVENAATLGLAVYEGGIEYFEGQTELFDIITLNHVIEHVHDPIHVLKACHTLLKPGGQIWLETPNIDSFGHTRFKENWRGLEPPRHLVLFNRQSLQQALLDAGFQAARDMVRPSPTAGMYQASFAMQLGRSPYDAGAVAMTLKLQARFATLGGMLLPRRREFLTMTAHKAPN